MRILLLLLATLPLLGENAYPSPRENDYKGYYEGFQLGIRAALYAESHKMADLPSPQESSTSEAWVTGFNRARAIYIANARVGSAPILGIQSEKRYRQLYPVTLLNPPPKIPSEAYFSGFFEATSTDKVIPEGDTHHGQEFMLGLTDGTAARENVRNLGIWAHSKYTLNP